MTSFTVGFALLFVLVFNVNALETDNFLTWGVALKDSSKDINNYINIKSKKIINEINSSRRNYSCEEVRNKIIVSFRGFITHPMEHWVERSLGPKKVYPSEEEFTDREYYMMSIYSTEKFDVSKYFSLSRNININGIYLGTDKLSHWMSTGERYYKIYVKALKKVKNEEEAYKRAVNYGIFLDRFILGGISSGVFSFGDLEANFQGLLFNRQFCRVEKGQRYLVKKAKNKWYMQHEIDVRDYVNPNFDETFNPSLFSSAKWKRLNHNFKKENCKKIQNQVFRERFEYYSQILKPSFSFKYIEELKEKNIRLPKYQHRNYTNICK